MKDKTIVVCRWVPRAVEERLKANYQLRLNPADRVYDADELVALASGADALLICHSEKLTASLIERLPGSIKVISTISVGFDHIDLGAAKERGILVTNTPDVLNEATAETAMMLMLGAARRASEGDRIVRENRWNEWSLSFMVGTQLTAKHLGIVGMGRVGQVGARMARGFGMVIHYHNRRPLDPALEHGAIYHPTLDALLAKSEFLSLHCPATHDTRFLLNPERIDLLPPDAIVVNTARGSVVDDEALIGALKSGRIAAAGLDVFNGEPNGIHPGYRGLENTFLLPHVGSATHETRDAMGFRALDNLDAFFAGSEPLDRVV